jgi:hypothetical protein
VRRLTVVLSLVTAIARADHLSPEDLARKNTNGYITGLPLVAYSTDIGFGGGARVYYYWNGARDDHRFANTPYLFRVFLQAFTSTRGIQFHWLDLDAPKIFDSPYRVRSQLIYARNINSNYFGLGNAALQPLHFPGSPAGFGSYANYTAAQQRVQPDGTTFSKYDQYDLLRPVFLGSVERLFLGDRVRVLGGLGYTYASVTDYTGKQVDAVLDSGKDTKAVEAPTRLAEDCAAHKLVGCGGGREGFLRFGVSYDTRDFEPDPNSGVFADLSVDVATVAIGSEYDYVRVLGAVRGYYSPIPEKADLVLAGRATFDVQTAGTPFFSLDSLPYTEDFRNGLGGHRTLRGFRQDRFVGRTMGLLNGEVRWTFTRFCIKKQKFALIAVPFLDIGRSFDDLYAFTLSDWRTSYGGALRISWNLATIVTVDYGRSSEDTGFYINFNHIF